MKEEIIHTPCNETVEDCICEDARIVPVEAQPATRARVIALILDSIQKNPGLSLHDRSNIIRVIAEGL